jgi:hypothetical protein
VYFKCSPIRALIKSGLTNNNVILYYGARNQEAVPLQVGELVSIPLYANHVLLFSDREAFSS